MTQSKSGGTAKVAVTSTSGGARSSSIRAKRTQGSSKVRANGKVNSKGRNAVSASVSSARKQLRSGNGGAGLTKTAAEKGRKGVSSTDVKLKIMGVQATGGSQSGTRATTAKERRKLDTGTRKASSSNGAGVRRKALESIVKGREKLIKAKSEALLSRKLRKGSSNGSTAKAAPTKGVRKAAPKRSVKGGQLSVAKIKVAKGEKEAVAKRTGSIKASQEAPLSTVKAKGERRSSLKGSSRRVRAPLSAPTMELVESGERWEIEPETEGTFKIGEPVGGIKVDGGDGTFFSEDEIEALLNSNEALFAYKPSRRQRSGIPDAMTLWGRELHKRPLLTHEQEVELAKRMEKGDEEARRIFIESNYRLVVSIAQKYRGCGVPLEDLIQAGNIGLIQAVDHYDWRQGTRFSTCAVMWIRQAILRAIDSHARIVRLSMRVSEQVHRVAAARQALIRELGRDPTIDEIARRTRLSRERVKELMGYMAQRVISIDDPLDMADGLDVDEVPSFSEYLADDQSNNPEEVIANREMKKVIEEAIKELPDRTQHALKLRFGFEDGVMHTYDEIGYQLGLSRQRAMQLVQLGLQQLREHPKVKMLFLN